MKTDISIENIHNVRELYPHINNIEAHIILLRYHGYKNYEIAKIYHVTRQTIQNKLRIIRSKILPI